MGWGVRSNGHGKVAKMPAPAESIPILGQPFEVTGFMGSVGLTCKCERPRGLLVTNIAPTQCPSCHRAYILVTMLLQGGQPPQFQISVIQPEQADHLAAQIRGDAPDAPPTDPLKE